MSSDSSSPKISAVVPALNESAYLRRTVEQLRATLPPESEIIIVDDGSTDGSTDFAATAAADIRLLRTERRGATKARNYGAEAANGAVIIFVDAHIDTPPGWWEPLVVALADHHVGAAAPAITVMGNPASKGFGLRWKSAGLDVEWLNRRGSAPYAVPILPGGCLAMRRDTFLECGGFDSDMRYWGSADGELSLRLWLLGYELRLAPQVEIAHLFRRKPPYFIDWTAVLHNMLRLTFIHFKPARIARVVEALKRHRDFSTALALTVDSQVWARRADLAARRIRDDDWFFDSFGMTW